MAAAVKKKMIKKWTTDDCVVWAKSLPTSAQWQEKLVAVIKANELTGSDMLALKNKNDFKESLGLNAILAKKVWTAFKAVKTGQIQDAASNVASVSFQQPSSQQSQNQGFALNLFGQSKFWDIATKVTKDTKVRQVKEYYKNESGVGASIDNIVLYAKSKELLSHQTLQQCGIVDDKHLITVKFKAVGGMSDDEKYDERERQLHFKKYGLKKSSRADCLIGYDDDDDIDRAEICPKGHAMAAETMFNYIVQCLEKNIKSVTIPCPMCKIVLDWDKCTQIADMTGKEYGQWTRVIDQRLRGEQKKCPHCKAECQRKKGVIIFRMRCVACNNPDWCWNCLKPWKGGGLIYCSNADCHLIKDVNRQLAEAPLFTPKYVETSGVKIPKTRACPMCLTFMEHIEACKHMTCVGCTGRFCFICLGKYDKEKGWPCSGDTSTHGGYQEACQPAPVQVFK